MASAAAAKSGRGCSSAGPGRCRPSADRLRGPARWLAAFVPASPGPASGPPAGAAPHRPGQELFGGGGIALLDGPQDARDFTHRRHRGSGLVAGSRSITAGAVGRYHPLSALGRQRSRTRESSRKPTPRRITRVGARPRPPVLMRRLRLSLATISCSPGCWAIRGPPRRQRGNRTGLEGEGLQQQVAGAPIGEDHAFRSASRCFCKLTRLERRGRRRRLGRAGPPGRHRRAERSGYRGAAFRP